MHYQRSFLALGILLCSWSASRAGPGDPETLTAQASAAVPSFPKMFQGQLDPAAPAAPADPAPSDAGASFAGSQSSSSSSVTSTSTQIGTGFTDSITTRVDTSSTTSTTGGFSPRRRIDAYHDIIGFEYAVLDGRGSVGVRAPIVHQ